MTVSDENDSKIEIRHYQEKYVEVDVAKFL